MRKRSGLLVAISALLLAALACNGGSEPPPPVEPPEETAEPTPTDAPTSTPEPERVGTVSRQTDVVEHGGSDRILTELFGTRDLFDGDLLNVREGGEGLLDFGDQMRVRLFNSTTLGIVKAEVHPDTPTDIRLFLEEGGITAELREGEGQAVIETPGGAEITVLGTQLFVAYSGGFEQTTVGNFEGIVVVESGGSRVSLNTNEATIAPDDQPPAAPQTMRASMDQFERLARTLGSPLAAADEVVRDEADDPTEEPPDDTAIRTIIRLVDGEVEPDLATSFDVSESGGLWTFELEEGVFLEDGKPLTSGEISRALDDWSPVVDGEIFVEVVDDLTFILVLDKVENGELSFEEYDAETGFLKGLSSFTFVTRIPA